ncbi:DNA polymerase III subunit delta [Buchnera aphidicola (Brachycaudus cardui)]|uniref:DNA polymerase III subunit delta n=1 Tax=Buchnera aphidicola (Brachycaudus cardui) TaxID=557993 RepID=A0A4D6Y8G1_9GAMM|nr:DNA polymerase III subunit delta [Buchnera aphidicola]QCI20575.1 DNA polymerase III subunit delta [Buchnera aphidicola (Brachycaudus cardui)]
MNIIQPAQLKEHLIKNLYSFYVLLGEDFCLINKNQDLILKYANQKGFIETITIDIEQNKDWEKVIRFCQTRNLFFNKTILIINFIINTLNIVLIKNINKISFLLHIDILIILKLNHLSGSSQIKKILHTLQLNSNIVSCFTPYNLNFTNWVLYEIEEKNINIEKKAFFLLCKYYEGDTLFIYKILDILLMTYPNTCISVDEIKKIILDFFNFSELHWINAIFQGQIKKAMYILNTFHKKRHNPLILIRSLQKDLLKLIYMNREKNININMLLKQYNISSARHKFFMYALKKINNQNYFKAIRILVNIEINIKKKYNNSVWMQLQKLTLMLSSLVFYT